MLSRSHHGGLEADLPPERLEARRVLGALEGAGAGSSGKGGSGKVAGLSAGVLAADDPPLFWVNAPRAVSGSKGDGIGAEASGLPASGELRARCFPLLTSA